MFRNRKMVGLFSLAAVAVMGLASAPAMAGNGHRGDRYDGRASYRSNECAPRGRVVVSLGFTGKREYRERDYRGGHRGHKHYRNDRWCERRSCR